MVHAWTGADGRKGANEICRDCPLGNVRMVKDWQEGQVVADRDVDMTQMTRTAGHMPRRMVGVEGNEDGR